MPLLEAENNASTCQKSPKVKEWRSEEVTAELGK